jgi:hypothetical protein
MIQIHPPTTLIKTRIFFDNMMIWNSVVLLKQGGMPQQQRPQQQVKIKRKDLAGN